jgi:hypothetical protein
MQQQAIAEILALLPARAGSFAGSAYPLPVRSALLGDKALDLTALRADLLARRDGEVKDLLEPLLLAAEAIESTQDDRADYFITDLATQGYVFTGSKWRAGWALVLGGEGQQELVRELQERRFMVFSDLPGQAETRYIGLRLTSPIYFLQMMLRYGLVWGRIAPGHDHEMGHFLEDDMPGLIIITKDLPPLTYLIALGLMKLGAPAVVPSTFPFPYGNRIIADGVPQILERGSRFRNLRQRYFLDEVISLPPPCNPAYANERFDVQRSLGGNPRSFFCLQPAGALAGSTPAEGTAGDDIGICVTVS